MAKRKRKSEPLDPLAANAHAQRMRFASHWPINRVTTYLPTVARLERDREDRPVRLTLGPQPSNREAR